jgi:hypothetical protein
MFGRIVAFVAFLYGAAVKNWIVRLSLSGGFVIFV